MKKALNFSEPLYLLFQRFYSPTNKVERVEVEPFD